MGQLVLKETLFDFHVLFWSDWLTADINVIKVWSDSCHALISFFQPICLRDDCLFNHRLLENNRDVYYSIRTGILLNLEGSRQVFSVGQNLPQTSLFLPKKNTVPLERLLLHREKRNRVVDPSDPHNVYLQNEDGVDSRAVPEDDTDLDVEVETETEAGDDGRNVSRETQLAPSSDDPWNVHSSKWVDYRDQSGLTPACRDHFTIHAGFRIRLHIIEQFSCFIFHRLLISLVINKNKKKQCFYTECKVFNLYNPFCTDKVTSFPLKIILITLKRQS